MTHQLRAKTELNKLKWVVNLLESKFFGACIDHQSMRKNEKNVFCIDCKFCFCKHCVASFKTRCQHHHRRLQICRYVYHDVVRLQNIQKHLDCSYIQTYKINGQKAVHLNPRPQDSKTSKLKIYGNYCEACGRHVQDVPNRFCSIACKISSNDKHVSEDITNQERRHKMMPFSFCNEKCDFGGLMNECESSLSSSLDSVGENIQGSNSSLQVKKRVAHKRKGVPKRAPLC